MHVQAPRDEELLPRKIARKASGADAVFDHSYRGFGGLPGARRTRLRLGPESTVKGPGRSTSSPSWMRP
jgi:hypothetical protein